MASYVSANLHVPRKALGTLYLGGGLVSFVTTRIAGRLTDRFGDPTIGTAGVIISAVVIYASFAMVPPPWSALSAFMLIFFAFGVRGVAYVSLVSKVPAAHERARFGSFRSAVESLAEGLGSGLSSIILATNSVNHTLIGMPTLASLSVGISLLAIPFMWLTKSQLDKRQRLAVCDLT